MYRSHFVTGEDSVDYPRCVELIRLGLMAHSAGAQSSGGDDLFRVTEAGKRYAVEHSPAPPKLTRSQTRYEMHLEADSSLSFGEWLRLGRYKSQPYVSWHSDVIADSVIAF